MKLGAKTAALILLFVILVLVNFLASRFPARADFTQDDIYTLSKGSRSLLAKIEEPVTLTFYFSRSLENLPIRFKNYATRVEEMLRQYAAAGDGRIILKVVDPQPDTDEETAARRAGVTPQQLPTGEAIYFGLLATQADQESNIAFFSPNREPFLEYDISQLIHTVQQFDKPRLGLISGLPLKSQMPMGMPGQQPQPDQLVIEQWQATFEVTEVEESADALPENLDLLAVVHPQNLGEKLLFAIDQFLLSGKPVIIAVDPSSYYFKSRQRQNMMMGQPQQGVTSDLPRLFSAWGIQYSSSEVVGDLNLATNVQTGAGVASFPIWLSLRKDQFAADLLPTSSLNTMLMIEAGAVDVASDRGYEVTPLVHTTTRSGTVASMMLSFTPPNEVARQIKDGGVQRNLAVLVQGTFKTAFPDGAPKEPEPENAGDEDKPEGGDAAHDHEAEDKDASKAGETPAPPAIKESAKPGTLVVVADTDWLLDDFSIRRMNFLGMQAIEPLNDNLSFASNIAEYLGGSEDLISIRGKGSAQRPFEVIRKMELAAQERYQAELETLEQRRNEIQQEIQKLQTKQTEGRTLIASPEVSDALERYRIQESELRNSIRRIRLSLREGIENLQNTLTVLNLLLVPAIIITVGCVLLIKRTRRQKASASAP